VVICLYFVIVLATQTTATWNHAKRKSCNIEIKTSPMVQKPLKRSFGQAVWCNPFGEQRTRKMVEMHPRLSHVWSRLKGLMEEEPGKSPDNLAESEVTLAFAWRHKRKRNQWTPWQPQIRNVRRGDKRWRGVPQNTIKRNEARRELSKVQQQQKGSASSNSSMVTKDWGRLK